MIKQGTTTIDTEPNAGDGGTTGENPVNTGTYKVSETAGTSPATNLGNYQKSIECKDQNGTGSVVASVGPDSAGPLNVPVAYQDDIYVDDRTDVCLPGMTLRLLVVNRELVKIEDHKIERLVDGLVARSGKILEGLVCRGR